MSACSSDQSFVAELEPSSKSLQAINQVEEASGCGGIGVEEEKDCRKEGLEEGIPTKDMS